MSRPLRYLAIIASAASGILLFLLESASENTHFFDKHIQWLYTLNTGVAVVLLLLVIILLIRLFRRWHRGQFGSRLMARLVLFFALIGILPGILIYLVSVQFVSRSIESWFNVQVESALDSGLTLSRAALDETLNDLVVKARNMALELSDMSDARQTIFLSQMNAQNMFGEADIVNSNGRLLDSIGGQVGSLLSDLPTQNMLQQANKTQHYAAIETLGDDSAQARSTGNAMLRWRVIVVIPPSSNPNRLSTDTRYLQLLQPVPAYLSTNAEALTAAYSAYQVRSLGRAGLRKMYLITLTLTLLLAIFSAIVCAFLLAGNFVRPLLVLAEGTRAVAEGDYSPRPIVATRDELGTLTQSFNSMTRQLQDARDAVDQNRHALENAKAYLESVLANMSAGVMVLDGEFRVLSVNNSVERILHCTFDDAPGRYLTSIAPIASFARIVVDIFTRRNAQGPETDTLHWQQQIEVPRLGPESAGGNLTLLTRGSRLPIEHGTGYLVVFDDISEVISAQRMFAWGEVAERLAHEIKNPLTPIQLSAERLQMKLQDKLEDKELGLLNRATKTIVNQVGAMQRMVDDFRNYAKTPAPKLEALDLNALINEVLNLYLNNDGRDIIHLDLADDLPPIQGDPNQFRQIIHNLLKNAQEAISERKADENATPARIEIKTEIIQPASTDGLARRAVRFSVYDNGPGFAADILGRAFEPYVTSKAHGTGLGLALVKKIVDEHGGRIELQNMPKGAGAKISVLLLKLAV